MLYSWDLIRTLQSRWRDEWEHWISSLCTTRCHKVSFNSMKMPTGQSHSSAILLKSIVPVRACANLFSNEGWLSFLHLTAGSIRQLAPTKAIAPLLVFSACIAWHAWQQSIEMSLSLSGVGIHSSASGKASNRKLHVAKQNTKSYEDF